MDFLQAEIQNRKTARPSSVETNGEEPAIKRKKFLTKKEKDDIERLKIEKVKKEKDDLKKIETDKEKLLLSNSLEKAQSNKQENQNQEKILGRAPEDLKKRLREAGRVVTYFGESDWDREQRWLQSEIDEEQSEEYQRGLKNDLDTFRRQLEALEADEIEAFINKGKKRSTSPSDNNPFPTDESILERLKDKYDLVLFTFKRLLALWEAEIRSQLQEETSRKSSNFQQKTEISRLKQEAATFKQTSEYLKPFFKSLRKRTTPSDIIDHMVNIVTCMREKEYLMGEDVYLRMSIGNSPWPIGVTMVGIHERSAREKISSNQIAHVLNDETQRKYIQSVKRLMSYCQKDIQLILQK